MKLQSKNIYFKANEHLIRHGDPCLVAAIVNVTPDSFSDGGKWFSKEKAVQHALRLIEEGAGMLDIGGESTRPGSTLVEAEEEIARIIPVIKEIRQHTDLPISVDTWKAKVAKAAIEAGADIINDITGLLGDPDMARVIADSEAGAVLMFNPAMARPNREASRKFPRFGYGDAFSREEYQLMEEADIFSVADLFINRALQVARKAGLDKTRLMIDPGIGFALSKRENLLLIKHIEEFYKYESCIFLGVSRKRFLVNILSEAGFNLDPETEEGFHNRDASSTHLTAIAAAKGIELVRTHTAKEHVLAATIGYSLFTAEGQADIDLPSYDSGLI